VKHEGHHEEVAPCCPPTPAAATCVTPGGVMRGIQDLGVLGTIAFTGLGAKGSERGEASMDLFVHT